MASALSAADVARLTRAIESVSRAADPREFPDLALRAACAVVPCDVATYNEVLAESGTRVAWHPHDVPHPPDAGAILERYMEEHPVLMKHMRTGDGSPHAISDFLSPDEFRRLNIYREIFGPMGLADQLAIALPAPRPVVIGIALNRSRRGFDERDRLMANMIRPYLVQAHRSLHLAAAVEAASAVALDDRVGLLVSSAHAVRPIQDSLPGWLPAEELFPGGRLDDEACRWLDAEREPPAQALPMLSRPLVRATRRGRCTIRFVTTAAGPVVVVTRERDTPATQAVLEALGLTPREAEVLHHLTRGSTNAGIGRSLGISPSTVKRHLEAIYRKLGVRSRTEAVALAVDTIAHG